MEVSVRHVPQSKMAGVACGNMCQKTVWQSHGVMEHSMEWEHVPSPAVRRPDDVEGNGPEKKREHVFLKPVGDAF